MEKSRYRTQLYLHEAQYRFLRETAARYETSIAGVVRDLIDKEMGSVEPVDEDTPLFRMDCLKENLACAEERDDQEPILNALQDLHFAHVNHLEFGERALRITDRLIACARDREDGPLYRCDKADFLAAAGAVDKAEREYKDIFESRPDHMFARCRCAAMLGALGRRPLSTDLGPSRV